MRFHDYLRRDDVLFMTLSSKLILAKCLIPHLKDENRLRPKRVRHSAMPSLSNVPNLPFSSPPALPYFNSFGGEDITYKLEDSRGNYPFESFPIRILQAISGRLSNFRCMIYRFQTNNRSHEYRVFGFFCSTIANFLILILRC